MYRHELLYHPGETNARSANLIIVNKVDSATTENIETVLNNIKKINPSATIIKTESPVTVEDEDAVRGKKVLLIEDGPTITHGSMAFGAAFIAAQQLGLEIIDPKPYLVGSIKNAFSKYAQLDKALPALGYSEKQLKELQQVINSTNCDVVLSGTPIDITRVIKVNKPIIRVRYSSKEVNGNRLAEIVQKIVS